MKKTALPELRPMSWWWIALALLSMAAIGIGIHVWASSYVGATDPASVRVDVLRLSLTTAAGTGGGLALWLAFRRQQSSEITDRHTIHDATERRITELYSSAAEQLGSDQAAVRLAGLYALERLGRNSNDRTLRQSIIDVVCAYLRMPFREDASSPGVNRESELEVRRAGQRLIIRHCYTVGISDRDGEEILSEDFWPNLDIDLSGASLDEFELVFCECRSLTLDRATIARKTALDGTKVRGKVSCEGTKFHGQVVLSGFEATFTSFNGATFESGMYMEDSKPGAVLGFSRAEVRRKAVFQDCTFGWVNFSDWTHEDADIRFKDCTVVVDPDRENGLPEGWTVGAAIHPSPFGSEPWLIRRIEAVGE
ncbi:hypothetical protein OG205_45500 [Lentzea sp. NBC_00516]|uniref:pentapeptide repeat-containing protein n=1 Tax=Lentzea sp. NBC_00516 TaxID=2903582 RepID=UPI002E809417|nr:pentapeptide repeat-containing protein [Lentzea sp. NBC_00516]WUD25194.1 hypothetical protein OG205_45500 [Lentzea sp. NBC_00516]